MKSNLWDNMRKLVTLIDDLRDVGVQDYISLPRICVLGMQSAGKSSLLENIVGLDFLPRGEGVVTRRPLELRLVHIQQQLAPWAIFKDLPNEKFTDFNKVRDTIEELTDKGAGKKKNIVPDPIELTVYSPDCPDLTIIDLPGITLIPLKDSEQAKNIQEVTTNMCRRYCEDERTIILCVVPANQDISTQLSLKLAREWDKEGIRTIGVITKIDIMGEGSDATKILLNEDIKLRLGYIGVKNRSQKDIQNKVPVSQALKAEEQFFRDDPRYSSIPSNILGTRSLIEILTTVLFQHIRRCLPEIMKEIDKKIDECEDRLRRLGPSMPTDQKDKVQLVYNLLQEYTQAFKNTMDGKYDQNEVSTDEDGQLQLTGGAKIKRIFNELYLKEADEKYHVCDIYSDKDIELADTLHQGDSIPGFPSFDSFLYLIVPKVQELIPPAVDVLEDIFLYMDEISQQILRKVFMRFPSILDEISEMSRKVLEGQKQRAEKVVRNQVESEMNYIFTNDEEYLTTKSNLVFQQKTKNIEPKQILVRELRNRVDLYYRILIRNLRDSIPKYIGFYLVKQTLDQMQMVMYDQMHKSDTVFQMLEEPDYITQERALLSRQLLVLKKAVKVIRSDPDLASKGRM